MIDLNRLNQLTKLVHDNIADGVTSELFDPEEQKVYNELYYIHTDLMKEYSTKVR